MDDDIKELPKPVLLVARILSVIAALGILTLMLLVFVSVFFRYVLNSPLLATEDIMGIMLGVTIFTAVPTVTLNRRHISVELLTAPFARFPKANRIRLIVIDLGIIGMTLFMARAIWNQAVRYHDRGTGTLLMEWPLHPVVYGFAFLLLLSAVLFTLRALKERGKKGKAGDQKQISL